MAARMSAWCMGLSVPLLFLTGIASHTVLDMNKLIDDKSSFYNSKIRPVFNQSKPVTVYVYFELLAIQAMDEVSNKFSVIGLFLMYWGDEMIAWNPQDYGNMTEFAMEGGDFWKPNLVLTNPHDKIGALGDGWNIVRYEASGGGHVAPGAIFDASCYMDITKYPWDEQICAMYFTPWGYSSSEVQIISIADTVGTTLYGGHGVWNLIDTNSGSFIDAYGSSILELRVKLRRKPRFVLVNIIIPIVFMSFLNMLVFLIPAESGERMAYCLTVLLAIAVFLTLVGDTLPKTSDPMSILSYYLLSILIVSVFIVFATVFSLRIYFRDDDNAIPRCLVSLVRCYGCKRKKKIEERNKRRPRKEAWTKHVSGNDDTSLQPSVSRHSDRRVGSSWQSEQARNGKGRDIFVTNGYPTADQNHGNWRTGNDVNNYMHGDDKHNHESLPQKRTKRHSSEDDNVTWKDISRPVDMMMFIVFVGLLLTLTAVLFAMILAEAVVEEDQDE